MEHRSPPSFVRKLAAVWLLLMALTIGTMIAGKVTSSASIGLYGIGGLMLVTFVKAKLILNHYLELKSAYGAWGTFFTSMIALILIILTGIYVAQKLQGH
jgi:hypothetical protein